MKSMHWIGIDDHADKWTIAHFQNDETKPAKEFELVPDEKGYRKLVAFAKSLRVMSGSFTKPDHVDMSCTAA